MTNPNESPQARLDAMAFAVSGVAPDPNRLGTITTVALDLITQRDAANARAAAAEAKLAEARAEAAEAKLSEATDSLVTLREALDRIESWSGDLVDADDAIGKPNPREIASEALAATSHATSAAVERIRAEERRKQLETVWKIASSCRGIHGDDVGCPVCYRALREINEVCAILNRDEGEKP